jgi:hypothetical protein
LFLRAGEANTHICTRGKFPLSTNKQYGSFQWTKGVKLISSLFVSAKLYNISFHEGTSKDYPYELNGDEATSVYDLIRKKPSWMMEMFGVLPNGSMVIRQITRICPSTKICTLSPEWYSDQANINIYIKGIFTGDSEKIKNLLNNTKSDRFKDKTAPRFSPAPLDTSLSSRQSSSSIFISNQCTQLILSESSKPNLNDESRSICCSNNVFDLLKSDSKKTFAHVAEFLINQELSPKIYLAKSRYFARSYYYGWINKSDALYKAHAFAVLALQDMDLTFSAFDTLVDTYWDLGTPIQAISLFKSHALNLETFESAHTILKMLNNLGFVSLIKDTKQYSLPNTIDYLRTQAWLNLFSGTYQDVFTTNSKLQSKGLNDSDITWSSAAAFAMQGDGSMALEVALSSPENDSLHLTVLQCALLRLRGYDNDSLVLAQNTFKIITGEKYTYDNFSIRSLTWLYRLSVYLQNSVITNALRKKLDSVGSLNSYVVFQMGLAALGLGDIEQAKIYLKKSTFLGFFHSWHLQFECMLSQVPSNQSVQLAEVGSLYKKVLGEQLKKSLFG